MTNIPIIPYNYKPHVYLALLLLIDKMSEHI